MKAIMQSIRPKWCELIANGKKTIEVRKTRPKTPPPFKVYIYCTKPPKSEFFWHHDDEGHRTIGEYANELIRLVDGSIVYDYGMRMCVDGGKLERMPEIYETSSDNFLCQKVIGEYICDSIEKYPCYLDGGNPEWPEYNVEDDFLANNCGMDYDEFLDYLNGSDGYDYHISELEIYHKTKDKGEFKRE